MYKDYKSPGQDLLPPVKDRLCQCGKPANIKHYCFSQAADQHRLSWIGAVEPAVSGPSGRDVTYTFNFSLLTVDVVISRGR